MSAEYTGEVPCSKCGTTHWMHGECKKPTEVMITLSTIITAEILAGLDKCPFCGAKQTQIEFGGWASYECLTSFHVEQKASLCRSVFCEQNELTTLRARVKELDAKVKRLISCGDRFVSIAGECEETTHWTAAKEAK